MAGGRPTEWTEEAACEWFEDALRYTHEKSSVISWAHVVPGAGGHSKTAHYLVNKYPDNQFLNSIKNEISSIFERRLIDKGYDDSATMSIFLLKNGYGYSDKRETEISGPNKSPIDFRQAPQVNRIINVDVTTDPGSK